MELIDTHAHLESYARHGTLEAMLARARAAGVGAMISIGTSPEDWAPYRELAAAHSGVVHYSVGLHPCSVEEDWAGAIAQMAGFWKVAQASSLPGSDAGKMPASPRPVALGECGLDRFHLPKNDPARAEQVFGWQRAAFAAQLALAKELECPLVVHSRGAFRETVEMIDAAGVDWARVVFHCFSEGAAEIAELNRCGGRGSFTGIITYKNADTVRAALVAQGLSRLMLETDAPWLAPVPHRGSPNEPAYVRHTAETAAQLFGLGPEEFAAQTTANAKAFFGI
jgi:TatD DNase family protein